MYVRVLGSKFYKRGLVTATATTNDHNNNNIQVPRKGWAKELVNKLWIETDRGIARVLINRYIASLEYLETLWKGKLDVKTSESPRVISELSTSEITSTAIVCNTI